MNFRVHSPIMNKHRSWKMNAIDDGACADAVQRLRACVGVAVEASAPSVGVAHGSSSSSSLSTASTFASSSPSSTTASATASATAPVDTGALNAELRRQFERNGGRRW